MKIPWQVLIVEIHGAGFSWSGIARRLDAHYTAVTKYCSGQDNALKITYDRGQTILELYAVLYRDRFERNIKPLLHTPGDKIPTDEAVGRLFR